MIPLTIFSRIPHLKAATVTITSSTHIQNTKTTLRNIHMERRLTMDPNAVISVAMVFQSVAVPVTIPL